MTTKFTAPTLSLGEQFPELPPRDDMLNVIYLHEPGHVPALRRHCGNFDTTVVASEIPIGWNTSQREGLQQPDLFIAFGVDRAAIIARKGYDISVWGKAPEFVLEIASENTAQNDERSKREGYANFGVLEYWRFDHTGGELYAAGLAGDRLVNGVYQPITIHKWDNDRYWGHSEALNLDVCWEYGQLRFYDPVAQRYLPTYDDEADGRMPPKPSGIWNGTPVWLPKTSGIPNETPASPPKRAIRNWKKRSAVCRARSHRRLDRSSYDP